LFLSRNTQPQVQQWCQKVEQGLREWNLGIWTTVTSSYFSIWTPSSDRAFAKMEPQVKRLRIECFSRGESLPGTEVVRSGSPRWAKFFVTSADQVADALQILKESHDRLKAAIAADEPMNYYSGT
jgi:hypothetical protein